MTFTYGRVRVTVRAHESSHVDWLAEFLSPWFVVGRESDGDVTVTFSSLSNSAWGAVKARADREGSGGVGCFVLDSRVVRHPAWRDRDGSLTIADRELDAVYHVAADSRSVEVGAGGREQAQRVALMRVVRELAAGGAVRSGALILHAAALARAGLGVLLVGPKRAGKTTLLLRALASPGTTFIANDRVVVGSVADDAIARGMPSIVSVRPEVLAALGPLASRLQRVGYHHAVTMHEAKTGRAWRRKDGGADLTPVQLCDLLGVGTTPEARVSAVVFPTASLDTGRLHLERLAPQDALPRLLDGLFGGRATPVAPAFTGPQHDVPDDPAAAERHCRMLLAQASAFSCRFDPRMLGAHDASAVVDEVLR